MEEWMTALETAFEEYGRELEASEKKQRVTDGLFGFGRSLKDDACHDRLDERVEEAVRGICAQGPGPEDAERAVRLLLFQRADRFGQVSAQWMLRAVERHALPLIPFLDAPDAGRLLKDYSARYRPWDRLPAQKQVFEALKAASGRR